MPTLAIHPGATIFVTGVNGLVGSHIVDQLLKKGYNVRGAVRDVEKCKWLTDYFTGKYDDAKFHLVSVPDMTLEGCYDDVVKGTSGFIHVASPLSGSDPHATVPIGINSALNALTASSKTPTIKRVVYTSSSMAATFPSPGVEKVLDQNSYNEEGIRKCWDFPDDEPPARKGKYLYAALKAESEKTCWEWVEENKPGFAFSTILPNCNFGKVLVPEKQGAPSTIEWAKAGFTGENFEAYSRALPPQFYISNEDCALLHVAALLYSDVSSERVFGFAERWDYNKLLGIYRKQYPERKFPDEVPGLVDDGTKAPMERAEEILGWVKEGQGWDRLEGKVAEMAEQFASGIL